MVTNIFVGKSNSTWLRVAELGSLSSGAKMAMKISVLRVFTIFATNALFLRKGSVQIIKMEI